MSSLCQYHHYRYSVNIHIWVCLKIGYIPNYSHLIGIRIINHLGLGVHYFSDTPIYLCQYHHYRYHSILQIQWHSAIQSQPLRTAAAVAVVPPSLWRRPRRRWLWRPRPRPRPRLGTIGKPMGKPWENHGKLGKSWENHGKMGKP